MYFSNKKNKIMFVVLGAVALAFLVSCFSRPPALPSYVDAKKEFTYNDIDKKKGSFICTLNIATKNLEDCNVVFDNGLEIVLADKIEQDALYQDVQEARNLLASIPADGIVASNSDFNLATKPSLKDVPSNILKGFSATIINSFSSNSVDFELAETKVSAINYKIETKEFPFSYTAIPKEDEDNIVKISISVSVLFDSFVHFKFPELQYEEEKNDTDVSGNLINSTELKDVTVSKIYFNSEQIEKFSETFKNLVQMSDEDKDALIKERMDKYQSELKAYEEKQKK